MRVRRTGLTESRPRPAAREKSEPAGRTYVGGVGYTHLRDFSAGPLVAERLEMRACREGWPGRIEVGDLSYDPVKIVHWLAAEEPPVERLVLVSAVRRGRDAGTVTAYRWDGGLPEPEQIQVRVSEAVTGVIHLDNLLVVLGQFGTVPMEIIVVEIEPDVEAMGEELTPAVSRGAREAADLIEAIVLEKAPEVRTAPIGGFGSANGRGRPGGDATPGESGGRGTVDPHRVGGDAP